MAYEEWNQVPLEDVAEEITVGHVGSMASEYITAGIPFLRSQNIEPFRIALSDLKYISHDFHSRLRKSVLRPGDVVIVRTGKPGACAVIPKWLEEANCSDLVIIRTGPRLDARFLCYYVNSSASNHVASHLVGAVQQHFNVGSARKMLLLLPPLPEQQAIAQIVGTLDDKIELNRQMNKTLESIARTIFKSWFIDFEPIPGIGPHKEWEDSALGKIPKGWMVMDLHGCVDLIIDYRGKTPTKLGNEWSSSGIPAISAKNIKGGRLVKKDSMNHVSPELFDLWMKDKLSVGDILLTSEAPLGELLHLARNCNFCLSQRVFAIRAKTSVCDSSYLYHWLASDEAQSQLYSRATGSTVSGIRQSELRKVRVMVPPIHVQNAASRHFKPILEIIDVNEETGETLAELRDTLLAKLLSGEIRIKDAEKIIGTILVTNSSLEQEQPQRTERES